jgi:uncharacterized protein (DUF2236 family)
MPPFPDPRTAARLAAGAGARTAAVPLRLAGGLVAPVRRDLERNVRRALGVPGRRPPVATEPGEAFLPPGSVTRAVHGDLASMMVGGLAALLLQTLHPLAMAGVADHSAYREDPVGRLRRTAQFVGATTYGTQAEAARAIAEVRRVHATVVGVAPDGRRYSADDPDLLTWIHAAEVDCFFRGVQAFGPWHFSDEEADRYLAETAPVAYRLGARWVPTSRAELASYYARVRPQLHAGAQALEARDFLLRGVARRLDDRAVHAVLVAAAVSLLPGWARQELQLPAPPLVDELVVRPLARALCAGLRLAVPPRPREEPLPIARAG